VDAGSLFSGAFTVHDCSKRHFPAQSFSAGVRQTRDAKR